MSTAAAAEVVLRIEGLTVDFPVGDSRLQAVRGVDLALRKGECLGIVGESGSGKSVTALAAMRLLGPGAVTGGRMEIHGRDISALDPEEMRALRGTVVSMIFQEPGRSFDPISSISKAFQETLRVKEPGLSPGECSARAVRLLTEVHIPRAEERLKSFPHQFSGGMLQRIMIALALANDPEILIADEPTTALDVTIQAEIVRLLRELQQRRSLSLIFISHNLALISQAADRILVMYAGVVMEEGPAAEVLERPRSPYTRALLNALPAGGASYKGEPLATIHGTVPDPTRPEPGCPFEPRCPLAVSECRARIPAFVRDADQPAGGGQTPIVSADETLSVSGYRCIFPGVKSWTT